MSENVDLQSGVSREHGKSTVQKWVFILGHLFIVLFCVWIVLYNGLEQIADIFEQNWKLVDIQRASILLACVFLYWLRHVFTLFYLIERKIVWSEVTELLFFMALFEITLLLLGGFLNSYSELQRKLWKRDSNNKGKCYTKGLFSYSMHINYFGGTLLFTGWCLFTNNYWSLALPIFMAFTFIFFHIPELDLHLVERYGDDFKKYSSNTNKFIPFIY